VKKDESLPTLVSIEGIPASGRHGANPGEQLEAQEFVVDVDVWIEAGEDTLEQTIDYRDIVSTVKEAVGTNSFVLLETLAEVVADSMMALGATQVSVVVHKPAAAASLGVDDVSATATVGVG
jgi:dihydroneopterin aldolase